MEIVTIIIAATTLLVSITHLLIKEKNRKTLKKALNAVIPKIPDEAVLILITMGSLRKINSCIPVLILFIIAVSMLILTTTLPIFFTHKGALSTQCIALCIALGVYGCLILRAANKELDRIQTAS